MSLSSVPKGGRAGTIPESDEVLCERKPKSGLLFWIPASFIFYLVVSVAITYPLCNHIGSRIWSGQWDTLGLIWASEQVSKVPYQSIAYPFGVEIPAAGVQPILNFLIKSGAVLFGTPANWNLLVLLGFPLSAAAAFGVFRRVDATLPSALLGGVVFGFTPGAFMQSLGGHAFFLDFALPILFGALLYNKRKRTFISAVFVGAAYSMVTLLSTYWGYFLFFFLVFFLLFDYKTSQIALRKFVLSYVAAGVVAMILIGIFVWPLIANQFFLSTSKLVANGQRRQISELIVYSSRLDQFLIPPVTNPLLGPIADRYWLGHPLLSNVPESTLYLGYVPLAILVVTLILLDRNQLVGKARALCLLFLSGFALMIVLSLPPYLEIGGTHIPLLGYFLYRIAPMFRVYQRTIIIASFFLAGIIVIFFDHLYYTMKKPSFYVLFTVLCALIGIEYWHNSSNLLFDPSKIPAVYDWLENDGKSKVIAEYPMVIGDGVSSYGYLYYQGVDKKRLVNGASRGTPGWDFYEKVKDLAAPRTVALLKSIGTDYLVVHASGYRRGDLAPGTPSCMPRSLRTRLDYQLGPVPPVPYGARLARDFGRDKVFAFIE